MPGGDTSTENQTVLGDNPGSQGTEPVRQDTVKAEPGKGHVTVELPGSNQEVPLRDVTSLPSGSLVDATGGSVTLRKPDGDWATLTGGAFQVVQPRTGSLITELRLAGGNFAACRRGRPFGRVASLLASASGRRKPVRQLWAEGKGRFRTRGRNGSATVRGTKWLTRDRCDGTLVKVKRGLVDVKDFAKRRHVPVPAGKQYFARARR